MSNDFSLLIANNRVFNFKLYFRRLRSGFETLRIEYFKIGYVNLILPLY